MSWMRIWSLIKVPLRIFNCFAVLKSRRYVKVIWAKQEGKAQTSGSDSSRPSLGIGRSRFGDKQMFLATWRNGRVCPPEDKKAARQPNTVMGKCKWGRNFTARNYLSCQLKWGEIYRGKLSLKEGSGESKAETIKLIVFCFKVGHIKRSVNLLL